MKARWTPKTIHITLDKNEGIEGTDEFWYQYQTGAFYADKDLTQEITKIEIPTRTGYVFTHYVGS
ncbi:hypothetical protein IJM86_08185 [bacterium]|nr:hypothetical protein [bacterium]